MSIPNNRILWLEPRSGKRFIIVRRTRRAKMSREQVIARVFGCGRFLSRSSSSSGCGFD